MKRAPQKNQKKMAQEDSRREQNSLEHLKYEIGQEFGLKAPEASPTKSKRD